MSQENDFKSIPDISITFSFLMETQKRVVAKRSEIDANREQLEKDLQQELHSDLSEETQSQPKSK